MAPAFNHVYFLVRFGVKLLVKLWLKCKNALCFIFESFEINSEASKNFLKMVYVVYRRRI